MAQRNKTREDSNTIEHIYIIHPSSSPIYLLEEHGVFEKKKRKRKKKFDLHAPRGPSFLRVCDDKEGNDRLSWPRFNTSVYEEKVRARNAKSRANFSILHSQTPPLRWPICTYIDDRKLTIDLRDGFFFWWNGFDLIEGKIGLILCDLCMQRDPRLKIYNNFVWTY